MGRSRPLDVPHTGELEETERLIINGGSMTARAPIVTSEEARVLGCLIEGSQIAPENYPMTMDQIVASCNQKERRNPITSYTRDIVEDALSSLRSKGLVAFSSGAGNTLLYMHRADRSGLDLSHPQMALLSILLLRGPFSAVQLQAHSTRQHAFAGVDAVTSALDAMRTADRPYVEAVNDDSSGDGTSYRHAFFVYGDTSIVGGTAAVKSETVTISREQLQDMQRELTELRNAVQALQAELITMREDRT